MASPVFARTMLGCAGNPFIVALGVLLLVGCTAQELPEHAYTTFGDSWRGERGFQRVEDKCESVEVPTPREVTGPVSEVSRAPKTSVSPSRCPRRPRRTSRSMHSSPTETSGSATEDSSASTIGARRFRCPSTPSSITPEMTGCVSEATSEPMASAGQSRYPSTLTSITVKTTGSVTASSSAKAIAARPNDRWTLGTRMSLWGQLE